MRNSDLALLGGLAAAAFLLSRSTRARPAAAPAAGPAPVPPGPAPTPGWDVAVGPVVLDETPAAGPQAPAGPSYPAEVPRVGGAYALEQGGRYRARVELSGMEALLGSSGAVADRFARVGFQGITVRELGGGVYELDGTWGGPTGSYPGPVQITRVWRIG